MIYYMTLLSPSNPFGLINFGADIGIAIPVFFG